MILFDVFVFKDPDAGFFPDPDSQHRLQGREQSRRQREDQLHLRWQYCRLPRNIRNARLEKYLSTLGNFKYSSRKSR